MKPFNKSAFKSYNFDDDEWLDYDYKEDGHSRVKHMQYLKKNMRRARRREESYYSKSELDSYNQIDEDE